MNLEGASLDRMFGIIAGILEFECDIVGMKGVVLSTDDKLFVNDSIDDMEVDDTGIDDNNVSSESVSSFSYGRLISKAIGEVGMLMHNYGVEYVMDFNPSRWAPILCHVV